MLFRVEGCRCNLLIQIVKQKYELECRVIIRVNWCPGLGWDQSNFPPAETRTTGHLERRLMPQTWVYECCRVQAVFHRGGNLCCWPWRAEGKWDPKEGWGWKPILCLASLLPWVLLVCSWDTQVLWCFLSPGSRESMEWALLWVPSGEIDSRHISREVFPVPNTCTLVKSKSKIQK